MADTLTAAPPNPDDLPSAKSPAYKRMESHIALCRDLFAGSKAVQGAGEKYLPKFTREKPEAYERRKAVALYNGFARVIRAMTGMVFQRPPQLGADVVPEIVKHWEDIDGKGTHGRVFLRNQLRDGITTGLNGILVDYPPVADPDAVTLADEKALNLRPYWAFVRAEDVFSVRVGNVGSRTVFTQVVIRQVTEEEAGAFGTRCRTQYRVYRRQIGALAIGESPITFEVWEEKEAQGNIPAQTVRVQDATPIRNQSEIPFAPFIAGEDVGPFETSPPLLDLAELNLDHWRVSTDRRYAMALASAPTLVVTGYNTEDGEIVVGPNNAITSKDPLTKASWLEITGTSFGPTKDELAGLENRMGAVGLAFLTNETRAAETAEAKRIDSAAQNASLTSAVDGLEDAAERALGFHAEYLKAEPGSISLNRDFIQTVLGADMIAQLLAAATAGKLSLETFLDILKRGNVLPDDVDVETEKERIMLDGNIGGNDLPTDTNAPLPKDGTTPPAGSGSGGTVAPPSTGDRTPPPVPTHPPVDLAPVLAAIAELRAKVDAIDAAGGTDTTPAPAPLQVIGLPYAVPTPAAAAAAAPESDATPAEPAAPLAWEITRNADGGLNVVAKAVTDLPAAGAAGGVSPDVPAAIASLDSAIARHERHMNGTEPTTGPEGEQSQQTMMDEMQAALDALTGSNSAAAAMEQGLPDNIVAAIGWLQATIARHERHMMGTEPTTGATGTASQQQMMDEMRAARDNLSTTSGGDATMAKKKPKKMKKGMTM